MSEQREDEHCAAQSAAPASHKKYRKSRFCILCGLSMLLAGSALLLACKLDLPSLVTQFLALAGGGIILYGNGYILFGLLIYADSRSK